MAVTAPSSVASLMRKTLDRQSNITRMKVKFKKNQIEDIIFKYVQNGNIGPYSELLKILQEHQLSDENFAILLEDCISCIVLLGRELKQFIDVLCNLDWMSRSEDLVNLYCRFLLSLITAHSYHCGKVMDCIIKLFKANGENWEGEPSEEMVFKWSNIHTVIAQIVATMPMSSDLLMQYVIEQFPYYKAGSYANRVYIYNLIWISKYIPMLREQIMSAIINRMIMMDVNLVDQTNNKVQDTVNEMDVTEQNDLSSTLDYCMLEMLKWLEEDRNEILNIMCNVFEKVLLPTYGIRYVQFLLLYTISINQQCADRILDNLWIVAAGLHDLGPGALATRRTAASHLSGLLARCIRVPKSRLIHYLKKMCDWCHSYVTATQESITASDNPKIHGAFYAICHAIFYLVAFKHHVLFANKENINFIESLNLPRLVTCPLNPLRTCPPQVQRSFSSVTRSHQLVYCQSVIDKNARHTLQSSTSQQYDGWFPYDPYTLPKSGKIIWPLCIEYNYWLKEDSDEMQYSRIKRKLDAEDDDYFVIATPKRKLASSLSNCISPGFKSNDTIAM